MRTLSGPCHELLMTLVWQSVSQSCHHICVVFSYCHEQVSRFVKLHVATVVLVLIPLTSAQLHELLQTVIYLQYMILGKHCSPITNEQIL